MDPQTGKFYSDEEAAKLPEDVQKRLVRIRPAPVHPRGPRRFRRQGNREVKIPGTPSEEISKRRAANKRAKQARKKNRK